MKAGLATSLSMVGVLATGAAALALNSSILDTASTTKGSPALATVVGLNGQTAGIDPATATGGSVTANGLADVVNGVEAPLSVDEPTTTTDPAPTTPSSTIAPATTITAVDKQFTINGVATVTLTATNGTLSVKAIDLVSGSGYKVANQFSHDGDDVRITFTSPTRTVEFSARLVRGQILAAVGNPRNGNLMPPPPGDNHERHEREEHDGDREEHERENDDD